MVECVRPQPGEVICDPACGTGGFLLAAYDYVRRQFPRLTRAQERHLRLKAIRGFELVDAVTRLGAMNLYLHDIGPANGEGDLPIITLDSLNQPPDQLYDVVLTNPPFGKKSSVMVVNERGNRERKTMTVVREDFFVSTSNKQLSFLQHVMTMLKPGGRAAVVIPDNVLFEGGAGESLRRQLLQEFDVHTLLRLPTGIFYAQGVKANVLFFDRAAKNNAPATKRLWVFDLRNSMRFSLRTRPWERSDLDEFVSCYNADDRRKRRATWSARNQGGRWRPFTYEELTQRHKCNLDIFWLEDVDSEEVDGSTDPGQIASEIMLELEAVMQQVSEIALGLGQRGK